MSLLVTTMTSVDTVHKALEIDFVNSSLYHIKFMTDLYSNVLLIL